MGRRIAIAAVFACMLVAASPAAGATQEASGTAFVLQVEIPGEEPTAAGLVTTPPRSSENLGTFSYPERENGSILTTRTAITSASTGPGNSARAQASARLSDVVILGGEITASRILLEANAMANRTGAAGALGDSQIDGLLVLGDPVAALPNERMPLGDWGYLVVLEEAVQRRGGETNGFRGFVTGLHVVLTAEHAGLPRGTEILVGYAEAAALAPGTVLEPPPEPAADTDGGTGGSSGSSGSGGSGGSSGPGQSESPEPAPPGAEPGPPPIVQNPPKGVEPAITGQGYVFPVYGSAGFSDEFGAARAITGWHHGIDIFAPLGTPVVAVSDGTLFRVGWNDVGGNRLWLRDRQGNEYYYAHLSAYTPKAVNGAEVKAGDVIGFVGDTGDAAGTPPHLHFEVHPWELLGLGYDGVVNPYPYLSAWYANRDLVLEPDEPLAEPEAAAVILPATDISSVSGLEPGGLARAWAPAPLLSDLARLVVPAPVPAPLVGGPPGFA